MGLVKDGYPTRTRTKNDPKYDKAHNKKAPSKRTPTTREKAHGVMKKMTNKAAARHRRMTKLKTHLGNVTKRGNRIGGRK